MKTMFNFRRRHHLARINAFLIAVALIAGMVGCGGGGVDYDLTIISTAGGLVFNPGEGKYTYDEAEVVNLVAEAEEGYKFVNWTGDVGTIVDVEDATTTITMNGDYDITANFEEGVTFADPNLEAAVREAIAIAEGSIYQSDLDGLTSLCASERNIADLTGLEYCTSLTELDLSRNDISDISPLASLLNLTYLSLRGNSISDICFLADISPLANLTSLQQLYLGYNHISDISPLANLTALTMLSLEGNSIFFDTSPLADISPLANLTSLQQLYLGFNKISDISPLANLTKLTELFLGDNQISDISPLANLTKLIYLWLDSNQISDIWPVANLTSLQRLWSGGNQISDISPVANLTSLEWLLLGYNQISDVSPLVENEGLGEGDWVSLTDNPLSDDSINIYVPELEARGVTVGY